MDSAQTAVKGGYKQGASLSRRNTLQIQVLARPRINKDGELVGFFGWVVEVKND